MIKRVLIFVISFIVFLCSPSMSFASTLTLSPSSANIPQGNIVPIQVKLNTAGESINGVSSYLSYPQDILEVTSINYGSSAFDIAAESTFGAGAIKISRGSISGVNGNSVTVATINFKGKSQGKGTVSFVNGSGAPRTANSTDSLNLSGSTGGTYTVGAGEAPKEPELQEGLSIKDVLVSAMSTNSATITWTTDKESDSTVEYGLQPDKYILAARDDQLVKEHKIVIQANLIPGETFHFRVRSKDGSQNEAASKDLTFRLKGYRVRITIVDSKGNPVKDAQVTLYSSPVRQITDDKGVAAFTDVSPARHLVIIKHNEVETSKEIDVKENALSEFTITLDPAKENSNTLLAIFYASLVIIIIIIIGVFLTRRNKSSSATNVPPMG